MSIRAAFTERRPMLCKNILGLKSTPSKGKVRRAHAFFGVAQFGVAQ